MSPSTWFFFLKIFWLFRIPWAYIWILGWVYFYKICSWNFDRDYVESVDCFFGWCGHLKILFPINEHGISFHLFVSLIFSEIFFNFRCISPPWLGLFLSILFFLMLLWTEFSLVIVSVQTHSWFLCLDFVSFNFNKFVH